MILSPTTTVECDQCGTEEHFNMIPLAGGDWREGSTPGWIVRASGRITFCSPDCAFDYDADQAEAADERGADGR